MYDKDALPNLRDWIKVTSIEVPKNMQRKCFGKSRYIISGIFDFLQDFSSLQSRSAFGTLAPILECCKENSPEDFKRLEAGGCYAFKFKNGVKFAIILSKFESYGKEYALVAVLWKIYPTAHADCMNDGISHIGIYSADTLPNISGWELKEKLPLPEKIMEHFQKYNVVTTESVMKFFADPPYYSGAVNLNTLLKTYSAEKWEK